MSRTAYSRLLQQGRQGEARAFVDALERTSLVPVLTREEDVREMDRIFARVGKEAARLPPSNAWAQMRVAQRLLHDDDDTDFECDAQGASFFFQMALAHAPLLDDRLRMLLRHPNAPFFVADALSRSCASVFGWDDEERGPASAAACTALVAVTHMSPVIVATFLCGDRVLNDRRTVPASKLRMGLFDAIDVASCNFPQVTSMEQATAWYQSLLDAVESVEDDCCNDSFVDAKVHLATVFSAVPHDVQEVVDTLRECPKILNGFRLRLDSSKPAKYIHCLFFTSEVPHQNKSTAVPRQRDKGGGGTRRMRRRNDADVCGPQKGESGMRGRAAGTLQDRVLRLAQHYVRTELAGSLPGA